MVLKQLFKNPDKEVEFILEALDFYLGFIFITDEIGQPIYINKNAADCMGAEVDEILSLHCSELEKKGLLSESVVMQVIKTQKKQTKIITYSRTNKTIAVVCIPIFDENEKLRMTVSFSQMEDAISDFLYDLESEKQRYIDTISFMDDRILGRYPIIAQSTQSKKAFQLANLTATHDNPVLILGESGSGKEVLAHFIHQKSSRFSKVFIPVNCSAIPKDLMESQFFGYVKGAFTGADINGKRGLFDIAEGGTLFLDELAELSLDLQPKLLRVLETGKVTPVGGGIEHDVNVRIIAATSRDIEKMVKEGSFRKDLYYRLNVMPIKMPPLRERPEDIVALTNIFLESYNKKYMKKKCISQKNMDAFLKYPWPGNVRELKNIIERLVIISAKQDLDFADANLPQFVSEEILSNYEQYQGTLKNRVRQFERDMIMESLKKNDGDIEKTLEELDISRSSFYQKKY